MIENKNTDTIKAPPEIQAQRRIICKIDSTTYEVSIRFSQTSRENMNDKILRLIRNDSQYQQAQ